MLQRMQEGGGEGKGGRREEKVKRGREGGERRMRGRKGNVGRKKWEEGGKGRRLRGCYASIW